VVDISTKFLSAVPDTFGSFAIVGQSTMALLAGGALTDQGRKIIQSVLTSLRIPRYLWRETQALMSLVLLISLLGFRLSLPLVAKGYLAKGDTEYSKGQFASAESNYRRALDLWPQMVDCNTRLGALYEDLGEIEKSKEQYRLAVQGGDVFAFNNLARLHNLDKNYTEAFRLLWSGRNIKAVKENPQLQVSWYKNMGWARYGQKRYDDAEAWLTKAITEANRLEGSPSEHPEGHNQDLSTSELSKSSHSLGSAYCLRAQVYTELKKTDKISIDWEGCNTYANPSLPEADQWIGLAQNYERSQSKSDVDVKKPSGEKQ
jgi:tetratricopeptide (TPR) repeat protein